jgi:signal transduction histidine kinase
MYRILLALGFILGAFQPIQAQSKAPISHSTSTIDSLSKRFDAAKDDTAKIAVLVQAPKRIDEYYDKPAAILTLYNKALTIAQRTGDRKSSIKLLMEMAFFEMYALMDEPKAFQLYSQALDYAEAEENYESCAKICHELAAIYEHQNFKAEMHTYFAKAIAYSQKSPVLFLKPYRWASWGYLDSNKLNDALRIGRQAVSYVEERSAPAEFKALAYGLYYAALKRIPNKKQEAAACKQKIVRFLGEIKGPIDSDNLDNIAAICYEAEQYKLAIFFASQPLEKTDRDSQRNVTKLISYEIISNSYERLGQYQKSLENYKKYSTTYVKELKIIASVESGRKIIRAEGERNLLLKQQEIDQERFYRNLSVAIAAFILILGGVVFLFYRREQQRKRELAHLNATKDKLVAILSHDLYSPITNLQNNVSLTDWGGLSQPEFTQQAGLLGNQLAHVRNLLDNTLTWILSQMNGLKPVPKPVDVHELIESQVMAQQITATTKQITLTNQIPQGTRIRADENHLIVMIRNLLQNALKFTPPGGAVVISHRQDGNRRQLQVRDTGVGMPPERVATLFALGQGTSKRGTANERGTGLGLVLVRELAEANGGQVRVESAPGKGSTFTLTFDTPLH